MTRINLFRYSPSTLNSITWGKTNLAKTNKNFDPTTSTIIFAALLIACSLTVGCSNEKSQPASSTNQAPSAQTTPLPIASTPPPAMPVQQAAAKPVHRKVVHKAPPTLTYYDKTTGVSFQYPGKYALKTGDAARELVSAGPVPMDFIQPGGVALAAVALPDSTYPNSDLATAFFNVSMNKTLTADQCREFSVPQPNPATPADPAVQATAQLATPPISKLLIGDMELESSVTTAGGGTANNPRENASKYYHVFQNGACYEFALNVATARPDAAKTTKPSPNHIGREEVFHRLEQILATVKIDPVQTPEISAEVKTTTPTSTPAQ
jgi:hypothetical protein